MPAVKEYRLTSVQRAAILARLPNVIKEEQWHSAVATFVQAIPKKEAWRFITTGLLHAMGFTDSQMPKTWSLKGQLVVLSALSDNIQIPSLLAVAYEATFEPDNPDKSAVLPIPEFESAFASALQAAKSLAAIDGVQNSNEEEDEDDKPDNPSQDKITQMCESMALCTSTMTSMMATLMRKFPAKVSGQYAADHDSDDQPEEAQHEGAEHLKTIKLWREGIVTRVELKKAIETYKYPLAPFLKRCASSVAEAMLILKDSRRLLDPENYQAIMMLLSTALRDVEEEILEPGGRPAVQANHALAMSLLASRYSRRQLSDKLKKKPKKQAYSQPPAQQGKKEDYKKPWVSKPKKHYVPATGSTQHQTEEEPE